MDVDVDVDVKRKKERAGWLAGWLAPREERVYTLYRDSVNEELRSGKMKKVHFITSKIVFVSILGPINYSFILGLITGFLSNKICRITSPHLTPNKRNLIKACTGKQPQNTNAASLDSHADASLPPCAQS